MGKIAFLPLFCLLLLAPSSPARASEPETVRFGVCISLSGDFAALGRIYLAGVRLRMDAHNAKAAERGYRLEMALRDDRSDPEMSASLAGELMEKEGVVAVIGSAATDVTLPIVPVANRRGVPLIAPSATNPGIGGKGGWAFRVLFDDEFQGEALARYLRGTLLFSRAAILSNQRFERYCDSIRRAFLRSFTESGGKVVMEGTYARRLDGRDSFDFGPLLEQLKRSRPEAIVVPSYADDAASVVRLSLPAGMDAVFCGGDAWHKDSLLFEAGNNIEGACYVGVMNEESDAPATREFFDLLNRSNDKYAEPAGALGYDALSLLIEALKTGRTREDVREGLYGIRRFPLASGPITIDRERGTLKPAYIVRIHKEGGGFARTVVDVIEPN